MDTNLYFQQFRNKRVLIIGDAIIDNDIYGIATKISPDAPVPLIDVERENFQNGSLDIVSKYIQQMGGEVEIITCVGNDIEGEHFIKNFSEIQPKNIVIFQYGPNTANITRINAQNHQILRLEKRLIINQIEKQKMNQEIEKELEKRIDRCDIILILDYNMGFLNEILITQILNIIKHHKKKVIVRPEDKKYNLYRNVNMIIMNRGMASVATGINAINETSIRIIGARILNELHCECVFIPFIEQDSYFFQNEEVLVFPSLLKYKGAGYANVGKATVALLALMGSTNATNKIIIETAHFAGSLAAIKNRNEFFSLEELKEVIDSGKIPVK